MFYAPSFKPNIDIALASINQIQQDQECKKLIEDDQAQHEREMKQQMDKWDSESDSYDPIKATLDERLPFEKQKFYEVVRRKGSTSVQVRKIWRKNEKVKYIKRCISP